MSRKNKKRARQNAKPPAQTATPKVTSPAGEEQPEQSLADVEAAAMSEATEADLEAVGDAPPAEPGASAADLVKRAVKALALLKAQQRRTAAAEEELRKKESALEERLREVDQEKKTLDALEAELAKKDDDLVGREARLKEREVELLGRQEDIVRRELDADAGFSQRNRDALSKLEAEGGELREQFSRHRRQIEDERSTFADELRTRRADLAQELSTLLQKVEAEAEAARSALDAELAEARTQLEKDRAAVDAEAKHVRKEGRDVELDRELLAEDRAAFEDKVAKRAAHEIETKEGESRALKEQLTAARSERDRLAQLFAEREEADRRFGAETPEQVMGRLRTLEEERDRLRKALGGRPSAEAAQRLEELERQKELWEADRLQLCADLGEARQETARKRIAVTELESLRDEKRSLESANALLHEANRQLRAEVDALVQGVEGKSPFPSCSAMDTNSELQSTRPTTDSIRNLAEFACAIQHRMAWGPKTNKELYYSAEDVRSFLGGLAMSRLHLLQGISGTGKTSLPLAFARAIGAGGALVEVQAGWRDRQDLIGHFNTFERRFYESEFLQAMYRASVPCYRDTPFIIVLDEMNLSHPEQYFADLLSALEQDQQRQRLVLMTAAVDPAPRLLTEGGTKLPIPPNVWFVGTANHDETTRDFADKTYDRAHVMELPRNRETFQRQEFQPQNPVSLGALTQAFEAAVEAHQLEAAKAYKFLQANLGEGLGRRFRVGWGNRLERQMSRYVPVVVSAGGSVGEATDHILATKLLRKIRDRHDNRPEDLVALRDQIQAEWCQLDKTAEPIRSLSLLRQELHRLGHDDE